LYVKNHVFSTKGAIPPYIIIVTYIGDFFNDFSPDFAIFFDFSYAQSTLVAKTPFWGIFEGKKQRLQPSMV
jgi:hypothetical protein